MSLGDDTNVKTLFSELNQRLDDLENRIKKLENASQPKHTTAPAPTYNQNEETFHTSPPKPTPPVSREALFGGNWLVKVGIIAVVLGTAFFLKLAFDNNWIGVTGRIILGIFGGFTLVGLGQYFKGKYATYAQLLTGGGIAILYLTSFAAHGFYDLIGGIPAFLFMGLVTILAGMLALYYKSPSVALTGIIGGFVTPLLFIGTVNQGTLLVYTVLLDIGILSLAALRNWRPLTLTGLVGSTILFLVWSIEYYNPTRFGTAMFFMTTVFIIFVSATTLFHILWKRQPKSTDLALMTLNAVIYCSVGLGLLDSANYTELQGLFTFGLAVFYALLAYASVPNVKDTIRVPLFLGGISVIFLTIALPIQLDNSWITIAWATEAFVLAWLGTQLRIVQIRTSALLVYLLLAFRLIFFETNITYATHTPVINERFFTFVWSIAMIYLGIAALKNNPDQHRWEKPITNTLTVSAHIATLLIISLEIIDAFQLRISELQTLNIPQLLDSRLPSQQVPIPQYGNNQQIENLQHARNFLLSIAWALYSIGLVGYGIFKRIKILRGFGLLVFIATILKVFIYDVFQIGGIFRVASLLGLGIILLFTGYLYQRNTDRIKEFLQDSEDDNIT